MKLISANSIPFTNLEIKTGTFDQRVHMVKNSGNVAQILAKYPGRGSMLFEQNLKSGTSYWVLCISINKFFWKFAGGWGVFESSVILPLRTPSPSVYIYAFDDSDLDFLWRSGIQTTGPPSLFWLLIKHWHVFLVCSSLSLNSARTLLIITHKRRHFHVKKVHL